MTVLTCPNNVRVLLSCAACTQRLLCTVRLSSVNIFNGSRPRNSRLDVSKMARLIFAGGRWSLRCFCQPKTFQTCYLSLGLSLLQARELHLLPVGRCQGGSFVVQCPKVTQSASLPTMRVRTRVAWHEKLVPKAVHRLSAVEGFWCVRLNNAQLLCRIVDVYWLGNFRKAQPDMSAARQGCLDGTLLCMC